MNRTGERIRLNYCLLSLVLLAMAVTCLGGFASRAETESARTYFIDSAMGQDSNSGLSMGAAWKSLPKVESVALNPGDSIKFKRGSQFDSTLTITNSGSADHSIVLTDYGNASLPAPVFTSVEFDPDADRYGNCIRLKGSFIVVQNLYFHHTVAELSGRIGFTTMWELGAVYVDKSAQHCIVQNNEFFDCGVGIKSYGEHAVIRRNYIHGCSRILKEWNWGPIGIWLGGDHQEVSYNRIENISVVDPRINWGPNGYGRGADGSAIEIDDARAPKTNISIHRNFTQGNQGFLEVTWADVKRNPDYRNFSIHHNVSDDFQQFIALWRGANCRIENNTIIRRKVNANEWGVFNITQHDSKNIIRNNIVVVENEVRIFNLGKNGNATANSIIANNLYYSPEGALDLGFEGPGENALFADPGFVNYANGTDASALAITATSPAVGAGLDLGYKIDFADRAKPTNEAPAVGAFERP